MTSNATYNVKGDKLLESIEKVNQQYFEEYDGNLNHCNVVKQDDTSAGNLRYYLYGTFVITEEWIRAIRACGANIIVDGATNQIIIIQQKHKLTACDYLIKLGMMGFTVVVLYALWNLFIPVSDVVPI